SGRLPQSRRRRSIHHRRQSSVALVVCEEKWFCLLFSNRFPLFRSTLSSLHGLLLTLAIYAASPPVIGRVLVPSLDPFQRPLTVSHPENAASPRSLSVRGTRVEG
ncbi:unnamed protein product, partial [Ectocarpus sp. 12 AP-2014]